MTLHCLLYFAAVFMQFQEPGFLMRETFDTGGASVVNEIDRSCLEVCFHGRNSDRDGDAWVAARRFDKSYTHHRYRQAAAIGKADSASFASMCGRYYRKGHKQKIAEQFHANLLGWLMDEDAGAEWLPAKMRKRMELVLAGVA